MKESRGLRVSGSRPSVMSHRVMSHRVMSDEPGVRATVSRLPTSRTPPRFPDARPHVSGGPHTHSGLSGVMSRREGAGKRGDLSPLWEKHSDAPVFLRESLQRERDVRARDL